MVSHRSLSSGDQLQCSICLCVFTNPVCTPCGHSFCLGCISDCWDSSQQWHCPNCKEVFLSRPRLSVNVLLSKLTDRFRRSALEQIVEIREQPLGRPHITSTGVIAGRSLLLLCILTVVVGYTAHVCQGTAPTKMVSQNQETVMTTNEKKQKLTQRRKQNVQMAITNLDKKIRNLSNMVRVLMTNILVTHTTLAKHEEVYEKETAREKKMKGIMQYAVNVTLDPDTAHPDLILSSDGKQLWHGYTRHNLSNHLKRFDHCVSVLGKEGLNSGRFYYEVQVKEKTDWDLGVATESINRKGKIELTPKNGYWTMWLRNGNEYAAMDQTMVPLSLRDTLEIVGVFVDYEEGLVSFYDGDSGTHIYSLTGFVFTETLYPYFSPSLNFGGKNSAPMIISRHFH